MLFKRELTLDVFRNNQKDGAGIRKSLNLDRLALRQARISESEHAIW